MGVRARDRAWQLVPELPNVAGLIVLAIAEHCYGESLSGEVGTRRLAEMTGGDRRNLRRTLQTLERDGVIGRQVGTGRNAQRVVYTLQPGVTTPPVEGETGGVTTPPGVGASQRPVVASPRPHVPDVPAVAGTTPTPTPPAAAGGSARSARRPPRGKIIASTIETDCHRCGLPVHIGDPCTWGRLREGEKITLHVDCPSEAAQDLHWHRRQRPARFNIPAPSLNPGRMISTSRIKGDENVSADVWQLELDCGHSTHVSDEQYARLLAEAERKGYLSSIRCDDCSDARKIDHYQQHEAATIGYRIAQREHAALVRAWQAEYDRLEQLAEGPAA